MRTADFDYELPPELVAQAPAARREDARLLVLDRATGERADRRVTDLADALAPGDLLVLNDTRVLAARVFGRRPTGGRVEVLFIEPAPGVEEGDGAWRALVRSGGALGAGESISVGGETLTLLRPRGGGEWVVRAEHDDAEGLMRRQGKMPLPPYIRRAEVDPRDPSDRERYQTVFARRPGAIAAPTAGLHLTEALLKQLRAGGIETTAITLHVGLGTFLPIRGDDPDAHDMHEERYVVPAETAAAIRAARERGGRVVALGTTTVRALESAAASSDDGLPRPGAARTSLFIRPGHEFRVVDALLTNFHLPRSTLLCLVAAFAGRELILETYRHAVAERYRFYSYGDAMLIV